MRKFVHYILAIILVTMLAACAAPHAKHRGYENYPKTNIVPLQVDPNIIYKMTPEQRAEYYSALASHNDFMRDSAYTNAYTAYGEKQWHNNVEGGSPTPPNAAGGSGSGRGGSPEPTIASEAAKTLRQETSSVLRNTMGSAGSELSNQTRILLRDLFQ